MGKLIIGLTGGIASGKSTVAKMFLAKGVEVIDADAIAHSVSEEPAILQEISRVFGEGSVQDGKMNRAYVAKLVFTDEEKRKTLNDILHPAVHDEIVACLELHEEGMLVVDVPLMYEAQFDTLMDVILVVYAPEEVQVQRLMERDQLTNAEALARIHAQMPLAEKAQKADYVLDNSGSEDKLQSEFNELYEILIQRVIGRSE